MTLEKDLSAKLATMREGVRNKILILDVERLPGIVQEHWWDRADLQKKYIQAPNVIREPRTTIVCGKWHDSIEVLRFAEWDKGGRKKFLRNVHNLLSQADIVIGHNVNRADLPWLRGDFRFPRIGCKAPFEQLPDLPPFKTVDTLVHLRRVYGSGLPFKALDTVLKILGHPGKTDRYDPHAMERAVAGNEEPPDLIRGRRRQVDGV